MSRTPPLPRRAALALLGPLALGALTLARPAPPTLRTVALHTWPVAVALDLPSQRAVVLGADATVQLVDLTAARVVHTCAGSVGTAGRGPAVALDARSQRLFVADGGDGRSPSVIRVLDSRGGALRATVRVESQADALAVDDRRGQVLVATAGDDHLSVLDSRTGRLRRSVRLGAPGLAPVAVAVDDRTARAFVLSDPVTRDGADQLSVLDTRRGTLLRTVPVGAGSDALTVDAGRGRVFVANGGGGTVSMLDAHDGTLLRIIPVGGQPTALAVDERRGRIYVADADAGTLSLLDAARGTLLRARRVDPTASPLYTLPEALAVDPVRERVYLSTWGGLAWVNGALTLRGPGTLFVLDGRTLTLKRTLAVGVAPQTIAVDAGRGRVVVVNAGGAVAVDPPNGWAELWLRRLRTWLPWVGRGASRPPEVARVPSSVSILDGGG